MFNVDLNTWVLFAVALMNAVTLYYTRQTEKNTNSLVGRLVHSTAEASDAAGHERARKEGELKAALKAAVPPATQVVMQPTAIQHPMAPSPAGKMPLPVADDRVATATEESAASAKETAAATKQIAVANERVADAAEVKSKKTPRGT